MEQEPQLQQRFLIPTEIRKFCETTTVRGVPRILKAKDRFVFVVWLSAVVACASILIWQLTLIFSRYTSYQVNTVYTQSSEWSNPPFPDITLCNICPLVYEKYVTLSNNDYFNKIVEEKNTLAKITEASQATGSSIPLVDINTLLSILQSPMMYLNNFPIANIVSSSNNSLVLDCSFVDWSYADNNAECLKKLSAFWNPDYYMCYTLKLNFTERYAVRGLSAVLFVDDNDAIQTTTFNSRFASRRASGVRLLVHASGTKPDMKRGLNIQAGTETSIAIFPTRRTRLGYPYSTCFSTIFLSDKYGDSVTYSKDLCIDICLQAMITQECGCVWSGAQFTREQIEMVNFTICGNVSLMSINDTINVNGLNQLACALASMPYKTRCFNQCPAACMEDTYAFDVSQSTWPRLAAQLPFYLKYIQGQPRYRTKYDGYLNVLNLTNLGDNEGAMRLQNDLNNQNLIRGNFLQIKIFFDGWGFVELKDTPAFSFDAMGSSVGGTLSLWLGVSIMFVVELFELIYTVVMGCRQKDDQTDRSRQSSAGGLNGGGSLSALDGTQTTTK